MHIDRDVYNVCYIHEAGDTSQVKESSWIAMLAARKDKTRCHFDMGSIKLSGMVIENLCCLVRTELQRLAFAAKRLEELAMVTVDFAVAKISADGKGYYIISTR